MNPTRHLVLAAGVLLIGAGVLGAQMITEEASASMLLSASSSSSSSSSSLSPADFDFSTLLAAADQPQASATPSTSPSSAEAKTPEKLTKPLQPQLRPSTGAMENGKPQPAPQSQKPAEAATSPTTPALDPLATDKEFDRLANDGPAAPAANAAGQRPDNAAIQTTPTGNVVINLINKLVDRGVLTADDAKNMVLQAQAEAETQKVQNESDMFAIAKIAAVETVGEKAVQDQAMQSPLEASRDAMSVSYIPAPVRDQITEEIRRKLAAEGLGGGHAVAATDKIPPGLLETLSRLKPEGEIRMRFEAVLYPTNNDVTGSFPNFNAINTGSPFDVTGNQFSPQWNTGENRNRARLLARFGFGLGLDDNFSVGMRLATGDSSSPVTANQSLGLPSGGQGGDFSKYAIWLDRAFIRYDLGGGEDSASLTAWTGRFDNPFISTPLIYDEDLGFDGIALKLGYNYQNVLMPTFVAGAFPVFNSAMNFSSTSGPEQYESYDKYLFAIQGGTKINLTEHWSAQIASAYYYFYNIEGQLSSPYTPLSQSDAGDTDNSRPSFAQKGNTYRPLRSIVPDASNEYGAINQWQYYGLATPYQVAAITGRLDYDGFEPIRVSLVGEFVKNLAFDSNKINEFAVNNRGEVNANDTNLDTAEYGAFEGGDTGWLINLEVGRAKLEKLWDWQVAFGYRWIGSDAVVDGLNDSEFGLGGSNMKGFTVAGRMALSPNVYLGMRWFGAESIAGPQFDLNIFQLDLGAKF
jgi:polyhydroxyalkanoate synthesis regulator phasin